MRSRVDVENNMYDIQHHSLHNTDDEDRRTQKVMLEVLLDIRELLWKEYANGVSPKGFAEPGDAERGIYA